MAIEFGLLTLGSYLVGSVPAAYLVARLSRGIDLRQHGSGQLGAGNLLRTTSKKLAAPVVIYDLGKGAAMVWVAQLVGLGIAQQVIVGLAAIIGHNWPVFLRFSGGRGLLTTMGVAFFLMPWGMVVFVVASPTLLLKSSPVPVLGAIAALPLASWGLSQPLVASWGLGQPLAVTLGLLAMLLIMIIRRLAVRRAAIAASVSSRELFINRLLFDRDIRDRKTWVNRRPSETSPTEQPIGQQEKAGKG